MQNVSSRFNKRSGILYIYDKVIRNKLVVETNMAYKVITSEDKRIIKIKIDNEEDIRIEIKNSRFCRVYRIICVKFKNKPSYDKIKMS